MYGLFSVSDLENKTRCAIQVATRTTGMGITTPDIITDMPGEDAAASGPITGPTAGKTKAGCPEQNQKSDKLSVKY